MKYTLHGFNQSKACKLDLGLDELAILRWFIDFKDTDRMQHREIDGKVYYWVVYSKVLEDLPILNCNVRSVANKFKKLESAGILLHKTFKAGGTFSYYGVGEAYTLMIADADIFDGSQKIVEGVDKKLSYGSQKIVEGVDKKLSYKDSSINNSSTKDSSISNKKIQYFDSEPLNTAFLEFIKMRKQIKSPMSDKAIELAIKKLKRIAVLPFSDELNEDVAIQILNESIMGNWKGLFPLKEDKKKPIQQSTMDAWRDA